MSTKHRCAGVGVSIACLFVLAACGDDSGSSDSSAGGSGGEAGSSQGGSGGAGATAEASATLAALTVGSAKSGISGKATFTAKGDAVDLTITLDGCTSGEKYPVHIHTGTSCDTTETQMGHWDAPRGEGIDDIPCADGKGMLTYERSGGDATKAWTIGGSSDDIVGHVLVVHNPKGDRVACGKITM